MKTYDTIIIGGGIAGLACAHRLQEAGKDFLLITEDIGGKIVSSADGVVNYGAYFFSPAYTHAKKFLRPKRRMRFRDLQLHGEKPYSFFSVKTLPYLGKYFRLRSEAKRFRKHLIKFRKRCEHMSQKDALEQDEYLRKLYFQNCQVYLQEKKLSGFVQQYVEHSFYGLSFISPKESSTFFFLQWVSELLLHPIYSFEFDKTPIKSFEKKIVFDSVKIIQQNKIKTKNSLFHAKNIVVALPPHLSAKLLDLKKHFVETQAYMFHVSGKRSQTKKYCLYPARNELITVSHEPDGTFLVYTKNKNYDLSQLFTSYEIIAERAWNPAFVVKSTKLFESHVAENMFVIGEQNMPGMEDCYLAGLFAANKVIEKST